MPFDAFDHKPKISDSRPEPCGKRCPMRPTHRCLLRMFFPSNLLDATKSDSEKLKNPKKSGDQVSLDAGSCQASDLSGSLAGDTGQLLQTEL